MKQIFLILSFLGTVLLAKSQEPNPKLNIIAQTGHYSASLFIPKLRPLHLGGGLGVNYQINSSAKHKISQAIFVNYFYHENLQKATQLYSEFNYTIVVYEKLLLTPVSIGGGYVLSKSDLESFEWNQQEQKYEEVKPPVRHNWLISIGGSLGYKSGLLIRSEPVSFNLGYRFQVQGIIIEQTVPVLAYSSLIFGVAIPFSF